MDVPPRSPFLVERMRGFGTTIFAEMTALAQRTGAINLGQGFPDTDGPPQVLEAAVRAIREGRNQYPPGPGVPELRQAIAAHQQRFYGLDVDPDTEVLVTAGRDGGDRDDAARAGRARRRGRDVRAVLRLLRRSGGAGRRRAAHRRAARARLRRRRGGAARGVQRAHARGAAQLAAQPDGQGVHARRARPRRRAGARARGARRERRGVRAPALQRRAYRWAARACGQPALGSPTAR